VRGRLATAPVAVAIALAAHTSPTTHAQAADVTLVLADQTFAIEPEQPWRARFVLDGDLAGITPTTTTTTTTTTAVVPPAVTPPPATSVRVIAHRPVDDRAELAAAIDGDLTTAVDSVTLPAAIGAGSTLAIEVPTTLDVDVPGALTLRRPGLHPVTVELLVDGTTVGEHTTFVERLPLDGDAGAMLNVAIVAAVPDPGPAPTTDEVTEGREQLSQVAELAEAVDGPISVQLPPVLVDDLDTGAPAVASSLRTSLEGDEVLAVPANVLDPSSAVAIDAQQDFVRELRNGEAVLTAALPASLPQRAAWLVPTPISTDAAAMLAGLGFRSLVLSPDIYTGLDGNIGGFHDSTLTLDVDLGTLSAMPAIVVTAVNGLLDPATLERTDLSAADAAVQIVAELVTTRRELGVGKRRSAVLSTPTGTIPDADVAGAVARYAASVPTLQLAPLSALPSTTDTMLVGDDGPETVTLPATAGPDLEDRASRIELTRVAAAATGSMLSDPTRNETWQAELDTLLSTGLTDEEAGAELDRISAETLEVRQRVEPPAPFTFTLTGRSSPLRWNLRNNGDEELEVVVRASSPKLTFPEGDQRVTLAPLAATEVVIPVEARTLGTSAIGVEVLTPAFEQRVTEPVVLTARVNALTGLGQVVTGGAIVVLLSWWFAHFRRRRRRRLAAITALEAQEEAGHDMSPDAAEAVAVTVPDQH
jgi:hypothetical protein